MRRSAVLLLLVLVLGCSSAVRIDGSSEANFVATFADVRADEYDGVDADRVDAAFRRLAAVEVEQSPDDPGAAFDRLRRRLDGLTGPEIVAEAAGLELSRPAAGAVEAVEAIDGL